jgi:hypothetical protein
VTVWNGPEMTMFISRCHQLASERLKSVAILGCGPQMHGPALRTVRRLRSHSEHFPVTTLHSRFLVMCIQA